MLVKYFHSDEDDDIEEEGNEDQGVLSYFFCIIMQTLLGNSFLIFYEVI